MTDRFSTESLRRALGARPFKFYERVESTQDIAREWALSDPALPNGTVVIAEEQTAGRGRGGRAWISPPGSSLMCSIVLRPRVAPERLPRLIIAGGLAVTQTVGPLLPEGALALKWPNDVLVKGRKLCGILTEATWTGNQLGPVILGIGLNVRVDFAGTALEGVATSLEAELGRAVDRHVLLATLLGHVTRQAARVDEPALLDEWRRSLGTLGRRVAVFPQVGDVEAYHATAVDVDDTGALIVRLDTGEQRRVVAADVGLAEL
jgi:BirA family transcriptional regulator, biotin operon repressor / biotin---[acetyl-CoA-carboxylase] ligase